ncbi:MAG: hypothetical protein IGS03_13530 [Candidatus Sericytochromatia bacterium]|nr:hypothetical protein [Candidatus Sericytochromatia bacterium]
MSSDSRSFIEPFKARFLEVFNASSSGEDPYRQPYYGEQPMRKRRQARQADWEQESLNLFEDFLSLDEEKITHGLAKAKVRKALDKKYRKSRRADQLNQETEALEDLLEVDEIPVEITAAKLARIETFCEDLERLLRTRHPQLLGWVDLLSRPAWKQLVKSGLQPRFVLNLMLIAYYRQYQQEAFENPEARLFLQLHIQDLGLGLKAEEIELHIEKFTIDLDSFDSLVNQTLHALEREPEMLNAFVPHVQARCAAAQRYALYRLGLPHLDPERRLARFHLLQRYRRVRDRVLAARERLQARQQVAAAELKDLSRLWHGQPLYLALLAVLHHCVQEGLPRSREQLEALLAEHPLNSEQQERLLQALELGHLEAWLEQLQHESLPPPNPGFVSDAVLDQAIFEAIEQSDWNIAEKWALCKAYYVDIFRRQGGQALSQQVARFLPASLT